MVIDAKENLDSNNIKFQLESETEIPRFENETQRKASEDRNKGLMRVDKNDEDKRFLEEKRKNDGMERHEAEKN